MVQYNIEKNQIKNPQKPINKGFLDILTFIINDYLDFSKKQYFYKIVRQLIENH